MFRKEIEVTSSNEVREASLSLNLSQYFEHIFTYL